MKHALYPAIVTIGVGLIGPLNSAKAATWNYSAVASQTGSFTASFDAVPSAAAQDTVIGLSQDIPSDYTSLAAIVRFNSSGQIDVRNGGSYEAAVTLNYATQATYHVRMVVDIPSHTYSVFVTPPGQSEIALASDYAFRSEQAGVSTLAYEDEGYSGGTVGVSDFTFASTPPPPPGNCAYTATAAAAGITDDGCSAAGSSAPNHPTLLAKYGNRRPPFNVAGVDYYVGVPAGGLKDPSTASLPAGCRYGSRMVTCNQSGTTISGYDFSANNTQLSVNGSGITITGNKFGLGGCSDPLINVNASGSTVISHNSIDGAGGLCKGLLVWGTLLNGEWSDGATVTIEYNAFTNIPQDAGDFRGPNSGAARIVERYNLFYLEGWTGHPDGIQLNGGNFDSIDFEFNTYYNTSPPNTVAGTQPFHIEAQLTAALSNSTLAHNTAVTPGNCQGGRNWPNGCSVNFDIACKQDYQWPDHNANFSAFGNYIDWSGAIAPLENPNCPSTTWGKPLPNFDLNTGAALAP